MRFRLLTYNIHRAIGVDGRFRPDRIIGILEHYNADIVLLQEVDKGAPRSNHLDLADVIAKALRYDYYALGLNVTLRKGKYGNATLTRFPIGRQKNLDLSHRGLIRRGAQHTAIEIPVDSETRRLEVFNIHLGLSAGTRKEQLRRLLASQDIQRISSDSPCIIAGDMNDWQGLLWRQRFLQAGFRCASNRRTDSRWSIRTFPAYAPTAGLDKIFYRGPLKRLHVYRSRLQTAKVASDHLPLIAEFEM